MKTQLDLFHGGTFRLRAGQPMRIGAARGDLGVVSGSVWLTRRGDAGDHVLDAGQYVALAPGDAAVIEPWRPGAAAVLDWQPRAQPSPVRTFLRGEAARALRAVAFGAVLVATGLRNAAAGFAAFARSAASTARRAQGCIDGAESIAPSGALK